MLSYCERIFSFPTLQPHDIQGFTSHFDRNVLIPMTLSAKNSFFNFRSFKMRLWSEIILPRLPWVITLDQFSRFLVKTKFQLPFHFISIRFFISFSYYPYSELTRENNISASISLYINSFLHFYYYPQSAFNVVSVQLSSGSGWGSELLGQHFFIKK